MNRESELRMKKKDVKKIVREGYAKVAKQSGTCCSTASPCCGGPNLADEVSKKIGYTENDLKSAPEGSNLGLGCGNPVALASLKKGDRVLDLGSGAGFDCFLAAREVGPNGGVIGVDMTPEMIEKARQNAEKAGYDNVEFRLGEIENLPVADNSVDVVISNCVINLSSDKARVFSEVFRVLRPGGRVMVSDLALVRELPAPVRESSEAYVACLAGAILKEEYLETIKTSGFRNVTVADESFFPLDCIVSDPAATALLDKLSVSEETLKSVAQSVVSLKIAARKPGRSRTPGKSNGRKK